MIHFEIVVAWMAASVYLSSALLMGYAKTLNQQQRRFFASFILMAAALYACFFHGTHPYPVVLGLLVATLASWWRREVMPLTPLLLGLLPLASAWMLLALPGAPYESAPVYGHTIFAGVLLVLVGALLLINVLYAWQYLNIKAKRSLMIMPLALLEEVLHDSTKIFMVLLSLFLVLSLYFVIGATRDPYLWMKLLATLVCWSLFVLWHWGRQRGRCHRPFLIKMIFAATLSLAVIYAISLH
jgi:hypothetical protein